MAIQTLNPAPAPPTPQPFLIDPAVRLQTWQGWGTSLAWWAHVVGAYPEPIRSEIVKRSISDLGLTIVRYNIGGGEAPGMDSMEPRARIPGFLRPDGTYDWDADGAQRWVLERAIKLGAKTVEAFSDSPPYFMTVSGSVTGAHDGKDNLKPDSVGPFASYLATATKHFEDAWHIRFASLEPMNEPASNWWRYGHRQEGCHVSPGQRQSELIVETRTALDALDLTTPVSASDENSIDEAVSSWDALYSDAKDCVARINTHAYSGSKRAALLERAAGAGKPLWMSEYGDGDATGMTMAHEIVRDVREMGASAWVYWQVVDHSGWGCLDMDLNRASHDFTVTRKYRVLGQFSKFIRPGAQILPITDPNSICALYKSQLVIVTVSTEGGPISFDLSKFKSIRSVKVFNLSTETPQMATANAQKQLTIQLDPHSVTTLVLDVGVYTS